MPERFQCAKATDRLRRRCRCRKPAIEAWRSGQDGQGFGAVRRQHLTVEAASVLVVNRHTGLVVVVRPPSLTTTYHSYCVLCASPDQVTVA